MQISALILAIMASLAVAVPTAGGDGNGGGDYDGGDGTPAPATAYSPCVNSALYATQPQCCSTSVLNGVAVLTCNTVPQAPASADDFKSICASSGLTAQCCTLTVIGISLLCATPIGV